MSSFRNPSPPDSAFDPPGDLSHLGRTSVRGGMYTTAGQGLRFVLQVGSRIVLARLLTPDDFGIVAMVTAVTTVLMATKDLGLTAATIQRKSISHAQVSTLFWINTAFSLAITLLVAAAAPLLVMYYQRPEVLWVAVAIGVSWLPIGMGAQHRAILSRKLQFRRLATVDALAMLLATVGSVLAAWMGANYWALVLHYNILGFATGIGLFVACGWWPGLPKRHAGVRSMLNFGGNMTGFNLINHLSKTFDQMLIGRFAGATSLGYYEQAYKLLLLPLSQINTPVGFVAVPALSRLQDDPERYRRFYARALTLIGLVTVPSIAALIVLSNEFIRVVLGPNWGETAPLFAILGLSALFTPFANATGWLFTSQGRAKEFFHWGIVSASLAVAAILVGLPWGVMGIAWGVSLGLIFVRVPLLFWFVGRRGPVGIGALWGLLPLPLTLAAGVMAVVWSYKTWYATGNEAIDLGVGLVLSAAVAGLLLTILPAGRRAVKMARAMLKTMLHRGE